MKWFREVEPEVKIISGVAAFLVLAVAGFAAFFMTTVATKGDVATMISPLATKADVATLATGDDLDTLEDTVGTLSETVAVLRNTVSNLSETVGATASIVNNLSATVGVVNGTVIALSETVGRVDRNTNAAVDRLNGVVDDLDGKVETVGDTIQLLVACVTELDARRYLLYGARGNFDAETWSGDRPLLSLQSQELNEIPEPPESCVQAQDRARRQ
jgi:hypothetical protein